MLDSQHMVLITEKASVSYDGSLVFIKAFKNSEVELEDIKFNNSFKKNNVVSSAYSAILHWYKTTFSKGYCSSTTRSSNN
jgi:hypothetical protein